MGISYSRDIDLLECIKSKGRVTPKEILEHFNGDNDYLNRLNKLCAAHYVKREEVPFDLNNKYHEKVGWWNGEDTKEVAEEFFITDNGITALIDFKEMYAMNPYSQKAHDLAMYSLDYKIQCEKDKIGNDRKGCRECENPERVIEHYISTYNFYFSKLREICGDEKTE